MRSAEFKLLFMFKYVAFVIICCQYMIRAGAETLSYRRKGFKINVAAKISNFPSSSNQKCY